MDNAVPRKLLRAGSPMPESLVVYREQLAAFWRRFGREMGPDDPFFFDPEADTPSSAAQAMPGMPSP